MTRRILVVDDSTTIQKVIRIAFAPFDVRVEAAANFMEALSAVHHHQPEVLLVDATLPGAQVPRDFKRLQDEARGAPLIILCGSFDEVDEDALRGAGFAMLVKKPFDSNDIVGKVKHILGGELARRQQGATAPVRTMDGLLNSAMSPAAACGERRPAAQEPEIPVHAELYDLAREQTEILEHLDPGLLNDGRRKGERAFQAGLDTSQPSPLRTTRGEDHGREFLPPLPRADHDMGGEEFREQAVPAARVPGYTQPQPAKVRGVLEPLIRDELAKMVREQIEDYCARHFQTLAREVLTTEIRRLSDEKSRHLVDN